MVKVCYSLLYNLDIGCYLANALKCLHKSKTMILLLFVAIHFKVLFMPTLLLFLRVTVDIISQNRVTKSFIHFLCLILKNNILFKKKIHKVR